MMAKHESVKVPRIPECDLCNASGYKRPAYADARIPAYGSWANVCRAHFARYGCSLGLGFGQTYVLDSGTVCRYCGRSIVREDGRWVDPQATGDDAVWRETCDRHETFTAEHEPES